MEWSLKKWAQHRIVQQMLKNPLPKKKKKVMATIVINCDNWVKFCLFYGPKLNDESIGSSWLQALKTDHALHLSWQLGIPSPLIFLMTLPVILFKKSKLQNLPEHSTAVKWGEAKDLKNGRLGAVLHEFKRLEVGSSWWETWRECLSNNVTCIYVLLTSTRWPCWYNISGNTKERGFYNNKFYW